MPQEPARKIVIRLAPYGRKLAGDAHLISQTESIFVTGASSGGVYPFTPDESLPEVLSQVEGSP